MDKRWNLDDLYTSFQDIQFQNDLKELKDMLEELKKIPSQDPLEEHLISYLKKENKLSEKIEKLYSYVNLVMNADTQNNEAIQYASQLENILASFADTNAQIEKWISLFDLKQLKDPYVLKHLFVLQETQNHNQYLLD